MCSLYARHEPHEKVSNAGVHRTADDYMHVLMTNVVGPFLTTKHFLPLLRKKQTRVVVNTSSLYECMNADYNNQEGMPQTAGCVLLPSKASKSAINMRESFGHMPVSRKLLDCIAAAGK